MESPLQAPVMPGDDTNVTPGEVLSLPEEFPAKFQATGSTWQGIPLRLRSDAVLEHKGQIDFRFRPRNLFLGDD